MKLLFAEIQTLNFWQKTMDYSKAFLSNLLQSALTVTDGKSCDSLVTHVTY